jgi:hypothetical protein
MIFIPGGTFREGSDQHYPEEAPVHRVSVDGFWIDPTPVTNRDFRKFVNATGYVTFAEIPPNPKDYPGALPHMLKAASLVFEPPKGPVDLRDWASWWTFKRGARTARVVRSAGSTITQLSMSRIATPRPTRVGRQGITDRGRMGVRGARRTRWHGVRMGRRFHAGWPAYGEHMAGRIPA